MTPRHVAAPYSPYSQLRLALSDISYKMTRLAGAPGRPSVSGLEHLPPGPAVYVGNHAGPDGPMAIVRALPVRLHPWAIVDMVRHRTAPRYLYEDVGRPVWGLRDPLGMVICTLIGHLAVLFLRSLCVIPVRKEEGLFDPCFDASLALLRQGRSLLIFPEDPATEPALISQVRQFRTGFAWLCARFVRETGGPLPVVPLMVHPPSNSVTVLPPMMATRDSVSHGGTRRLCRKAQEMIHAKYCEIEGVHAQPGSSVAGAGHVSPADPGRTRS